MFSCVREIRRGRGGHAHEMLVERGGLAIVAGQHLQPVYGVATTSRLLKIIGLFCKRALQKRRYSAKETCNIKEPTTCSQCSTTNTVHEIIRVPAHVLTITQTYSKKIQCAPNICGVCNRIQKERERHTRIHTHAHMHNCFHT